MFLEVGEIFVIVVEIVIVGNSCSNNNCNSSVKHSYYVLILEDRRSYWPFM